MISAKVGPICTNPNNDEYILKKQHNPFFYFIELSDVFSNLFSIWRVVCSWVYLSLTWSLNPERHSIFKNEKELKMAVMLSTISLSSSTVKLPLKNIGAYPSSKSQLFTGNFILMFSFIFIVLFAFTQQVENSLVLIASLPNWM